MGDIPLGSDSCMTVHVAVLGAIEFNTPDNGNLWGKLGCICVSCQRVNQNLEAYLKQ